MSKIEEIKKCAVKWVIKHDGYCPAFDKVSLIRGVAKETNTRTWLVHAVINTMDFKEWYY